VDEFQGYHGFSVRHIGLLEHLQAMGISLAMAQIQVPSLQFVTDMQMRRGVESPVR
jgi:hypothetical protein